MKLVAVIGGLAVGVAAVVGWKLLSRDVGGDGEQAAAVLAAGLDRAMAAARELNEPYRCARLVDSDTPEAGNPGPDGSEAGDQGASDRGEQRAGRFVMRERGHWLELEAAPEPGRARALILGVVADARGDARAQHVEAVRHAFEAREVDVVVSLGGLGQSQAEIAVVLEGLAGRWPLIAIPGDWEAMEAHRAATGALAERGVVDGARVRLIRAGAVTLATLPGAPHVERLMAGADGCVHTDEDAMALAEALGAAPPTPAPAGKQTPGVRVVLSHVPPRQRGQGATDRTPEGVHTGEAGLAEALARAGALLAIHGLVVSPGPAKGERGLDRDGPVVLSAGALDSVAEVAHRGALPPLALVVTVDIPGGSRPAKVRWETIHAPAH